MFNIWMLLKNIILKKKLYVDIFLNIEYNILNIKEDYKVKWYLEYCLEWLCNDKNFVL